MSIYVFVGPTLPVDEARRVLDAVYLPPVRQGDVYRLVTLRRPRIIGIVDGYFNQVPAVWHKEILWAMAAGVQVFGAASMGALRAAELAPFGMRGVGKVFEAYRDGTLPPYGGEVFEDDDEVAIRHGPAEAGYLGLSEAMVNLRCTLAAATAAGVIGKPTRDALVRLGKSLFYPERGYQRLLTLAQERNMPAAELDALRGWLPEGKRDQKRDDALAMLRAVAAYQDVEGEGKPVGHAFQHTTQWATATACVDAERPECSGVLAELRLEGQPYFEARRAVLERLLGIRAGDDALSLADLLRADLGAPTSAAVDETLSHHHGEPEAVEDLWRRELLLRELHSAIEALPLAVLERHLLAHLQERGEYQRLEARARRKRDTLTAPGGPPTETELSGLQVLQLQDWYFEKRLGRAIPTDLDSYIEHLGFGHADAFNRALLHEYVYSTS